MNICNKYYYINIYLHIIQKKCQNILIFWGQNCPTIVGIPLINSKPRVLPCLSNLIKKNNNSKDNYFS